MTVVDSHAHVFHRGLPLASGRRYTPAYDASWQDYLRVLDEHGVGRALLVQPSFLGTDNSYLLDALRARPDRFRATVVTDPDELATASLAALHSAGVRGIRLNLVGERVPALDRAGWSPLANRMAERGWHLEVQAAGEQWQLLEPYLRRWPGAVVLDHVGLPRDHSDPQWKLVLDLAARDHVWVKLSGFYRSPAGVAAAAAREIADSAGVDRLLWGSDWPWTRFERARNYGELLAIPSGLLSRRGDAERVLARNPARLLDWD